MHISAIVAHSENNVIGLNNKLPWHLPADLQHFKQITMGKSILMGRKTYESIGRPLPGRENIILTHDKNYQVNGCVVAHSIEQALEAVKNCEEVFVIGGAKLYEAMLPRIQTLYLTLIHAEFLGDAYFPSLNPHAWKEIQRTTFSPDEKNIFAYSFIVLSRA